ncbi:hypothetical protein Tco_0982722 [Tanacetum coccineum]
MKKFQLQQMLKGLTEAVELESYIAIREARAALLLRVNATTKEVSEQTRVVPVPPSIDPIVAVAVIFKE